MATEIKTLAAGCLKTANAAMTLGERILYQAPTTTGGFAGTAPTNRAALVVGMRFNNTDYSQPTFHLFWMKKGTSFLTPATGSAPGRDGDAHTIALIVPGSVLYGKFLRVDSVPLVLEPGDALVGYASVTNCVTYIISGIERDV